MSDAIALDTGPKGNGFHIPASSVLNGALAANLDVAVVIGWDADGDLFLAATDGVTDTLYLAEAARYYLLTGESAPRP